ncbi:MAG: EAL domain-containing protein [Gammaproteobacteria bacterium]|nr:EAL domain-containing protein [Gammaproteobacteria bacterium]MBU1646313.1 EAL domain-containing protein [Gammaproteobacteria bacterium]MBU1970856.1 EAL domain-containing protein [Gammaproteobacteria bacterium]
MSPSIDNNELIRYVRAKIDQLLGVMGTLPLRPEELDDATLIALDPIGIIAESFRHVIAHLNETNDQLDLARSEIRAILDTLGAAVVVLDLDTRIEDSNRRAIDWFFAGADRHDVIGHLAADVCSCADILGAAHHAADGASHSVAINGRDLQVTTSRILDEVGHHAKTVILFTDISDQKQIERHLQLYAQVFSHIGEGILITDADNRIVETNRAVTRITGYARDELIGNTPNMLKSGLHEPSFFANLWHTLVEHGHWQGEIYDRTRDGNIVPLLQTISAVRGGDGELTHYISVMTDISTMKETQTRLDFLAHHDVLTSLPNRLLFNDRLGHAIDRAQREKHAVALLFIDLDRFKNVNDSLGHHVGDLLLVEASHRLKDLVRRADTVARLGGDEFVVLMENVESQIAAAYLAEKIVGAFKQPFVVGNAVLHIGCSIGITLFPDDGGDAVTLLKNADAAMYRAKDAGRDGHFRYTAALSDATRAKLELDNALRTAVRENHFELHYQPIVDIARDRLIACEALLRWPLAPAGARTPDIFIPVAEETRLIVPLGQWILRAALTQFCAWQAEGLALDYVSVNISAVQMSQPDFTDSIITQLYSCGLPGRNLQIELTENVLMGDIELCASVLAKLRKHGIRVAIDDFGTGYSSLSYLKQLPIDNLKIDRSFVRDIPGDPNDCAIAAAVISLARTLGLDAIAEGIETREQQEYLARIGCTKVQGYLHSRPLPAAEFARYAAKP